MADQLDFALRFTGFHIEYTELATTLDLNKEQEPFLKSVMGTSALRNYKKDLKIGLSVVEEADINDYWPILVKNFKKTIIQSPPTPLGR